MEWPSQDSITAPARWQYLAGWGKVLRHAVHTANQHPIYGAISPISRIQRVGMGVATFTVNLSDPLAKSSYFHNLMLYWPIDLSFKERNVFTRRHKNNFWKLRLSSSRGGLLMPLKQQAKKGFAVLTE